MLTIKHNTRTHAHLGAVVQSVLVRAVLAAHRRGHVVAGDHVGQHAVALVVGVAAHVLLVLRRGGPREPVEVEAVNYVFEEKLSFI